MAISAAITSGQSYPERQTDGRIAEYVTVTGSTGAAGDSTTYTTSFLQRPDRVEGGAFQASFSGKVVTLTASPALGNRTAVIKVSGPY